MANQWLCSLLLDWQNEPEYATGETSALVHCPTRRAARCVGALIAARFRALRVEVITAEVSGSEQRDALARWKEGDSILVGTSTVTAGLDNTKCSLVVSLYAHHSLDQLIQTQARCGRRNSQQHTAYFLYVDAEQQRIIANAAGPRGVGDLTQRVVDAFEPGCYAHAKAQLLYGAEGVRAAAKQRSDLAGVHMNTDGGALMIAEVFGEGVCRRRLPWVLLDEVQRPDEKWFTDNLDCGSHEQQLPCDVCAHTQLRFHQDCKDVPTAEFALPPDPHNEGSDDDSAHVSVGKADRANTTPDPRVQRSLHRACSPSLSCCNA